VLAISPRTQLSQSAPLDGREIIAPRQPPTDQPASHRGGGQASERTWLRPRIASQQNQMQPVSVRPLSR
jgi:hypothetical protein